MKQMITFLKIPLTTGLLLFFLSAAQISETGEPLKNLVQQAGITIDYLEHDYKNNSHLIELNLTNTNDYAVNVSWKNEVKFLNDPNIALGRKNHNVTLEANSSENIYMIDLMEISTLQATLPVENFRVLNLEISKN